MPRRSKKSVEQTNEPQLVQTEPVEQTSDTQSLPPNKDDYLRARATIKSYRESQKNKPKRTCSEKQLAALAAGRMKNKRFSNKTSETA